MKQVNLKKNIYYDKIYIGNINLKKAYKILIIIIDKVYQEMYRYLTFNIYFTDK